METEREFIVTVKNVSLAIGATNITISALFLASTLIGTNSARLQKGFLWASGAMMMYTVLWAGACKGFAEVVPRAASAGITVSEAILGMSLFPIIWLWPRNDLFWGVRKWRDGWYEIRDKLAAAEAELAALEAKEALEFEAKLERPPVN